MSLRIKKIRKRSTICFMLTFFPIIISQCPESTNTLHRIGKTRYYIIQNTKQRGDFVTIEQARQDCSKHGLKLATVKNLLSLAVVGRPLERMAFKERMKDTWYWLDAKYDLKSEKYHWGTDVKDELKYTMILYRTPRPIGVSSHITYNNVYQKDQDKPQCLTLALPWLGSADHHLNTTAFFGHQTSFDERDCKSQQKRHAMCEASKKDCQLTESNPFVLDEDKQDYFEEGNWIFGDRKYIVNWKQKTFNDSQRYCKSLGLQLMNAGALEKFLIPHIKMWSREVTASQFWTGMSFDDETKQYMDSSGNVIADENTKNNFTESEFLSRSSKTGPVFCVALSLAYEFRSQMPCSNPESQNCQWSFIRYAPANCNNYHGTICQHPDYDERDVKWYSNFKTNLDDVLEKTALTTVFGYKGNSYLLRSKYKQTFGQCYCPKGYRMIRSHDNTNWFGRPVNTIGKEIYEYDYIESYWMVDNDLYNKDQKSACLQSYTEKGTRKFKEINCTNWHFYLCERLGRRPTKPLNITINRANPMKWEEGPQPRIYTPVSPNNASIYGDLCACKLENDGNEWNAVKNECVKRLEECPSNIFDYDQCQRWGSHVFYSIGGVLCNSPKQNDKCTFEKVIYTFYNNPPYPVLESDTKGINYKTDTQKFHQRWNISPKLWSEQRVYRSSIEMVPPRDIRFYEQCQMGNYLNLPSQKPTEKDGCATLVFDIVDDGQYEISIRLADPLYTPESGVYKRAFSVLLNDMYIVREINPNDYRPIRQRIELIANLRVFDKRKMLELHGHPSKKIEGQKLKLEMCYSFCARIGYKADPNWMLNSVSVLKFASKPDDPCQCKLKNVNKEYNTVTNQCIDQFDEHGGWAYNHFGRGKLFCRLDGDHKYYAIFGRVANIERTYTTPYCKIEKNHSFGVNFGFHNGWSYDARSIAHKPLNRSDWQFKPAVWLEGFSNMPVEGVPRDDIEIYQTWASGSWKHANSSRSVELGCAVLLFQTYGDGYYEIAMKTGELYHQANRNLNRTFSVILNGMYIVKEFTVEKYRKSPHGVELVANFRIFQNSSMLELQGHPYKEIERSDKQLQLEICHSNCGSNVVGFFVDRNWVMYGLSIVKFNNSEYETA